MITPPWRASGVGSRTSLSITVATRQGNKPPGRSPNTSRFSTIGKDGKHDWGIYPRQSMNGSSMQGRPQHENISCPLLTSGVKLYHVKVKTGQLTKYPFNINNASLAADFEVYVCGADKLYYVIPVELLRRMHSDPSAMPDYTHPGLTIIDVHPSKEIIVYGTGGKSIKVSEYKNLTA